MTAHLQIATYEVHVHRGRRGELSGVAPRWNELWQTLSPHIARFFARHRLRRSIAHLDDRLLADVGFSRRDLGFAERLMRGYVAGGDIWGAAEDRPQRDH